LYPFPARARELRRLRRFAQKFPLRAVRLVSAVRAAAPDVVSVHCTRRFAPYVAVLRRATGVPHVLSLQEGALPPGMPENPGLFRLLMRAADAVAACSAEGAAYATRVGGARRVEIVPNGYDPAEFRPGSPFPHPRPYVLGLGRLEAQKGFDLLLEALARPGAPALDLVLAGEGAARPELKALARARGLAARVRFLGATDRPTTLALLRGSRRAAGCWSSNATPGPSSRPPTSRSRPRWPACAARGPPREERRHGTEGTRDRARRGDVPAPRADDGSGRAARALPPGGVGL